MIASEMTDARTNGHTGQPAASMNANTDVYSRFISRNCIWALCFQQAQSRTPTLRRLNL
jgi:uncharacterized membrane protein